MSDTGQEIHVIAEFQAKPGQETALRIVLQACVRPTRAEQETAATPCMRIWTVLDGTFSIRPGSAAPL